MEASTGIKCTRLPAMRLVSVCMFPLGWVLYFFFLDYIISLSGPPRWCCGEESICHCRRCGFDPWIGKIPWRNSMDRGTWQATACGVTKSQTQLSMHSQWHTHHLVHLWFRITSGLGQIIYFWALVSHRSELKPWICCILKMTLSKLHDRSKPQCLYQYIGNINA